jgi:hypothetical protein
MVSLDGTAGVRGRRIIDEALIDDVAAMEAADPGGMLRITASAGAQVRELASIMAEVDLTGLAAEGRPRAVVVAGQGTAARCGDIFAMVAGPRCPVPVLTHQTIWTPGWITAADLVIAVSGSGRSPEALGAAEAATRRGARLVVIAPADTELHGMAERARAPFIPVPRRAPARFSLWALAVPVLFAGRALGLIKVTEADLAETATRLDADADRCRPTAESFVNPAKVLALDIAGSIPVIWGSSPLATIAAQRFADTLSSNSRYPAVGDALGDAGRGRVGLLDGAFGALTETGRDIFADRGAVGADPTRLRIVLMRDGGLASEDERGGEPTEIEERRAAAVQQIAERRGVRVSVLTAEGGSPIERLASLIAVPDFSSVYLALAHGLDPMAVPAVSELKDQSRP